MELHAELRCECGCEISFSGFVPNNYKCFKCGNRFNEIKESKKTINSIKKNNKIKRKRVG